MKTMLEKENKKLRKINKKLIEACIDAQKMMVWLDEISGDTSPDGDEVTRILEKLNETLHETNNKEGETMKADANKLKNGGKCDYCGEHKEAEELGFIPTYDSIVCIECYEDHHGVI